MQKAEPRRPRVPCLFLGDESPENLAWRLYSLWPSAGLISAEAGVVFGGHGMGADKVPRNGLFRALPDFLAGVDTGNTDLS